MNLMKPKVSLRLRNQMTGRPALACTACASALSLPPRSLSLSAGEIIVNRCSLLGKCEVTPMRCLIRLTVEKKEVMRKGMTVEDYNTMEIA